ncbi:MAG: hypothetical protein FJ149_13075 [Euryarchaeota archaeon]|nr:hypothetical protein [Euryarchaeota archaeon]
MGEPDEGVDPFPVHANRKFLDHPLEGTFGKWGEASVRAALVKTGNKGSCGRQRGFFKRIREPGVVVEDQGRASFPQVVEASKARVNLEKAEDPSIEGDWMETVGSGKPG